ncbi:MAG: hypothetical protein OEW12_00575 [Deltaproteobacteria bacterium]|nr:hypothetical protein [Deltaproteobacteria bacterium]
METFFEVIFLGFAYMWMTIIASVPNIFMGMLSLAISATALTYFLKDNEEKSK